MEVKHEIRIRFQNRVETINCLDGSNLLDLLHQHGYSVYSPCGGKGRCGKCIVRVRGEAGSLTDPERRHLTRSQIEDGFRLACQVRASGTFEIDLSSADQLVILSEGTETPFKPDPRIRQRQIRLEQPSIDKQHDYWHRIRELGFKAATPRALQRLGTLAQKQDLVVTYSGSRILDIDELTSGTASRAAYGIAVDVGTTTVVLYLLDLTNGFQVGAHAFANPQSRYGADVITRIDYTLSRAGGAEDLKNSLLEALNQGVRELAGKNGLDPGRIYHAVFAGNTVMLHMLLGVNAASIANAPYVPIFTDGLEFSADELGLKIHPDGIVELLPCVSGYVGADIIADLLVADFESDSWRLLVDIGTNGEIILGNKERVFACSAAAGPAFEGANITFGMSGVPGAIAAYRIEDNGEVCWQTISSQEPRGICGSGLVDIIAALYSRGFVSPSGAFREDAPLEQYQGQRAYRVVPGKEIFLTQKDVREYQLAAGAIAAGIKVLIGEASISEADIDRFYLAGGFGSYINPESASVLGLIPKSLLAKVVKLGNGAGAGARQYLLDRGAKARADELKQKITYVELSARKDFQKHFMEAMLFPE